LAICINRTNEATRAALIAQDDSVVARVTVSQVLVEVGTDITGKIYVAQQLVEVAYVHGRIYAYDCQMGDRASAGAIYTHGCQMGTRASTGAIYVHGIVTE
jgi:hypothetical protein